jgi:hypothetical protein
MPGENGGMLAKEPSCPFRYYLLGISVIEIGREGVCAESLSSLQTRSPETDIRVRSLLLTYRLYLDRTIPRPGCLGSPIQMLSTASPTEATKEKTFTEMTQTEYDSWRSL